MKPGWPSGQGADEISITLRRHRSRRSQKSSNVEYALYGAGSIVAPQDCHFRGTFGGRAHSWLGFLDFGMALQTT